MELNDYQKQAMKTCMESSENFAYMIINLYGEIGEFSGKVAKALRKKQMSIGRNGYKSGQNELFCNYGSITEQLIASDELKKEAGDVLWQLSGLCSVMGWSLEEVAQMNLDKLASRQDRGVIDGDGDNR